MHYLSSVYFVSQPLHVSGIFVAHHQEVNCIIPLNAELNLICHLLALGGAHHILHISRIRVIQQLVRVVLFS
jgi:hypothetical protein